MKLLKKNYINAIFFLIANIVLLFFIQFELVLLLLIYEVIAILFVKKYFENKLRDKQKSKDITHNGSIEKEIRKSCGGNIGTNSNSNFKPTLIKMNQNNKTH